MNGKIIRVVGLALVVVVIEIQFVQVERSNPSVRITIDPPEEVEPILR